VQGAGYSKSVMETDTAGIKLETDMATSDQIVFLEILNQERYVAD
jgi:hypothetical protein